MFAIILNFVYEGAHFYFIERSHVTITAPCISVKQDKNEPRKASITFSPCLSSIVQMRSAECFSVSTDTTNPSASISFYLCGSITFAQDNVLGIRRT